MDHFVITGCARSGTGYMASLFTHLGLETQHETVFSPYSQGFEGWSTAPGESSWLAAPFIHELPPGTIVLHQIRHPLSVVQSLLGIRFFASDATQVGRNIRSLAQVARARGSMGVARRLISGRWRGRGKRLRSDFFRFVEHHCPEVFEADDEATRCSRYWVGWNRLVEEEAEQADVVYMRYRIEEVDAAFVTNVLGLLGQSVDEVRVVDAIGRLPTDLNTRSPGSIQDLPSPVSPELVTLARGYGYSL